MMPRKNEAGPLTERLTIGFTPGQVAQLDHLIEQSLQKGQQVTRSDLVRAAVEIFFLLKMDSYEVRQIYLKNLETTLIKLTQILEQLKVSDH